MNKPISIMYEEFSQNLTDLINNAGLPAFVVELILDSYLKEVKMITQKQYQMDKMRYDDEMMKNIPEDIDLVEKEPEEIE